MFDGVSLKGWKETPFTAHGQIRIEKAYRMFSCQRAWAESRQVAVLYSARGEPVSLG